MLLHLLMLASTACDKLVFDLSGLFELCSNSFARTQNSNKSGEALTKPNHIPIAIINSAV